MSAGQHIDYDALVRGAIEEAKRSVVRSVIQQVAKSGLVGGHHFLIAFNTQASGVSLSKRLREKYPMEMTIVLQHRFWDLEVSDDRFEVKLTFDSIPERLAIPFTAIKAFYDPSVPYMMPFDDGDMSGEAMRSGDDAMSNDATAQTGPRTERGERRRDKQQRRPRAVEPRSTDRDGATAPPTGPVLVTESRPASAPVAAQPAQRPKPAVAEVASDGAKAEVPAKAETAATVGAKVLDLSSFRGKKK
ncbi:MAG: ClpXP protease specificity-enhancing factor SspB [Hyphomicrobiaceae bacterium]